MEHILIITLTDAMKNRILSGFCQTHHRVETLRNDDGELIANPESKEDFFDRKIKEFISSSVTQAEIQNLESQIRDFIINNPVEV